MADDTVRRRVLVSGEVQGVSFRENTRRQAAGAGVAGWVANRPDGKVEAVFEGSPEAVDALIEFTRAGPTAATVNDVEVGAEEPQGLSGFDVR